MINQNYLARLIKLYEKIFNEDINNSKEFLIFVQGNPHLLRIKVEEALSHNSEDELLIELDNMIMEYIENNE